MPSIQTGSRWSGPFGQVVEVLETGPNVRFEELKTGRIHHAMSPEAFLRMHTYLAEAA